MTSATNQKPPATMATAGRQSRFPNFTMANGADKSKPIGSGFQNSIWSNNGLGAIGKREVTGSRGSEDSAFPTGPSGSGALTADSDPDTWVSPRGHWNASDSSAPRKTSGSTSPNRTRDGQAYNDLSTSIHFTTSRQSAGQSPGFAGNLPKSTGLDPSTDSLKYSPTASDAAADKDHAGLYSGLSRFGLDRSSRVDRRELDSIQPHYSDQYQGHVAGVGHAQRPSVHGSASFPTQIGGPSRGGSALSHTMEGDMPERFKRSFTLSDAPDPASGSSIGFHASSQPFQFNPGSVPWDSSAAGPKSFVAATGVGNATSSFMHDGHSDTIMSGFAGAKRGSIPDRASPAGNHFRSTMTSPRHMSDTPPVAVDPWSRPATRNGHEPERRGSMNPFPVASAQQPYMQHQHQMQQQMPPPTFFPSQNHFGHSLMQSYSSQGYDSFATGYRAQPMPVPGYGMPFSSFVQPGYYSPMRPSKDQDPTNGARSRLLDDFRANTKSSKRYELKDIFDHVVEFSGDQHGSRFIQLKLETANSDDKEQVFREIEPNAVQLMKDVFGNYVIQKFFEHGNQVQKKHLAAQMKGKVLDLSTQMYACRVVQKALEHVLVEQQAELVKELEPDILRIVKDQNGNHVVQKVIELVPRHYIGFVIESFRGQVNQLSAHSYGCRVIQRMLEHGSNDDKAVIMSELHNCASPLITDQYGNYVIQHVIQHGRPEDRAKAIEIVQQQLLTFSKHKFASNVVEKCIQFGTPKDRSRIREIMSQAGPDGTNPLQLMMKDQYGNYVIQKLLGLLEGPEREVFVGEMKPQFDSLKKVSNGRQIAAIDRLISATSNPGETSPANGGSTPASPGLQVDVNSTTPTPVLTMEPNTPQSSSPPSTNASAADDVADGTTIVGKAGIAEPATEELRVRVAEV